MDQVIAPITQFMTAAAVAPHISITSDMYRTLATHCSFREGTAKGSQCKHQLASGVTMWQLDKNISDGVATEAFVSR